jgi:anti-sigma regulatory factor (Ser/Thr protein kinase)
MESFLAELESFLRPLTLDKGLVFEVLRCSDLPAFIKTDPVRVRQCLINLVSNAIKFTEKGHVFVNIEVEHISGKDYIRFDVEDTGIGIPEDKQDQIFAAFSQADNTTTRKYGGTGLGLTITRQLAGLLGGKLTLKSEPAKGSVFTLLIPTGVDVSKTPKACPYNELDRMLGEDTRGCPQHGIFAVRPRSHRRRCPRQPDPDPAADGKNGAYDVTGGKRPASPEPARKRAV